jgi:multiple sugar transport system substrate-binding protein
MAAGHLPTRTSVGQAPGFQDAFDKKFPGEGLFVQNLENVTKARPVTPHYDEVSRIMGEAVVKVMLGQAEPQQALDDAAAQANDALAAGG